MGGDQSVCLSVGIPPYWGTWSGLLAGVLLEKPFRPVPEGLAESFRLFMCCEFVEHSGSGSALLDPADSQRRPVLGTRERVTEKVRDLVRPLVSTRVVRFEIEEVRQHRVFGRVHETQSASLSQNRPVSRRIELGVNQQRTPAGLQRRGSTARRVLSSDPRLRASRDFPNLAASAGP